MSQSGLWFIGWKLARMADIIRGSMKIAVLILALGAAQGGLIDDLQNTHAEVRRNACSSIGLKGVKAAIPYLVDLIQKEPEPTVIAAAVEALTKLTGQTGLGAEPAAWQEWWDMVGRNEYVRTGPSLEQVRVDIDNRLRTVQVDVNKATQEIKVIVIIVASVAVIFVLVMIYFVGHVSSKLKEWKDVVRQAVNYLEQSKEITKRTDRVLEELEAKKAEIFEFAKKVKEENETEIERYNDLLQKNTEHRMREEVMSLRQKAERELEETLGQLRQGVDLDVRRLADGHKGSIKKDFKEQHERFMKEVDAHTLFLQASFIHSQGKPEEALRVYKKLLAAKPDHQVAWEKMGNVYRELMRFDEALEAYQKAIELDPNDPSSYYNMAATFARLSNREKMLETLSSAIRNDGEFKDEALNDPVR